MAHYIAYAAKGGTAQPREMLAQVHAMLRMGVWGVPSTALLRMKLMPGDGLIVAVGAPYRRFVGDAVVASRYRRLSEDEAARLPVGLSFDHGITLARARVWQHGLLIAELWPRTTGMKSNPQARFFGAITPVRSTDAALIVGAGTGRAGRSAVEDPAEEVVQPAQRPVLAGPAEATPGVVKVQPQQRLMEAGQKATVVANVGTQPIADVDLPPDGGTEDHPSNSAVQQQAEAAILAEVSAHFGAALTPRVLTLADGARVTLTEPRPTSRSWLRCSRAKGRLRADSRRKSVKTR